MLALARADGYTVTTMTEVLDPSQNTLRSMLFVAARGVVAVDELHWFRAQLPREDWLPAPEPAREPAETCDAAWGDDPYKPWFVWATLPGPETRRVTVRELLRELNGHAQSASGKAAWLLTATIQDLLGAARPHAALDTALEIADHVAALRLSRSNTRRHQAAARRALALLADDEERAWLADRLDPTAAKAGLERVAALRWNRHEQRDELGRIARALLEAPPEVAATVRVSLVRSVTGAVYKLVLESPMNARKLGRSLGIPRRLLGEHCAREEPEDLRPVERARSALEALLAAERGPPEAPRPERRRRPSRARR
ncbi:MAG: hypothetical protein IT376_07670 [Polyangiaceae bacterium]|nr:hypothetical protein [Polyangiaceae bacterium]